MTRFGPSLVMSLVLGATSRAAPPSPWSLHHQSLISARLNPLGAIARYQIEGRLRLYAASERVLADNFIALALLPTITPASARVGVEVALQPLSVLRLGARYEAGAFGGYLGQIQSFARADVDYSDSALDARSDLAYATSGTFFTLLAQARALFGEHLALRDTMQAVHAQLDLAAGDGYFVDSLLDVLVIDGGWVVANDLDLLWLASPHWTVGLRHSFAWSEADVVPNHRVGPVVAYTFDVATPKAFERPTLLLVTGWYLEHRYRTGADVSRAVPYVVLAFAFHGRLL